jgi:hypothetical protein
VCWTVEDDPAQAPPLAGGSVALVEEWAKKFAHDMAATPQERDKLANLRHLSDSRFLDVLTRPSTVRRIAYRSTVVLPK